jgi:HlyD family secretion protein
MRRLVPVGIIIAILGTFAWTLIFLYNKSQADPVVFDTEKPFVTDIVRKTVATGAIVPRREIEIKPRVSGILETLAVQPGQLVKAGDLIARIRIVPNVVNLNSAEANVESARINFQNAKRELDRMEKLFGQSLVAEADFNRAEYEFKLRQQELEAAQSNLQLIRSGASKGGKVSNEVTSTVDGMVIDVPVKEGTSVTETNNFNPGTTIAQVADMSDMIFQGRVDESEVGKIKEGMALEIVIGAVEKKRFSGTLEYIAPKGVELEGAIQFEIRAAIQPEKDVFIRANYSANANIVLDKREKVLAIKESLLQFDKKGSPFVEIEVGEQRFERRDLEVGISDGLHIEILKGLSEKDRVKKVQATEDRPPAGGRRSRR